MKKVCNKCLAEKDIKLFPWKYRSKGIKATICKLCTKENSNRHYYANRQKYIDRQGKVALVKSLENKKYIWNYLKTHPCVDCGEDDVVVLEFDHVRGKKKFSLSMCGSMSLKTIDKEIKKCDVRCANCHRRRTAKQFNWYKKYAGVGNG